MYLSETFLDAVGETAVLDVRYANSALIHITGGAVSAVGFNGIFEASLDSTDGVDGLWFAVQAARTNSNTVETTTGVLALNAGVANTYAHRVTVANIRFLRVRATAITSGDVDVLIRASEASIEPLPVIQTHAVTQSGTWSVTGNTPAGTAFTVTSTASTNLSSQSATATSLFEISINNPTATAAFVKLYNKTSAPVVATDVPVLILSAPAGATQTFTFGQIGKRFSSGLGLAITANAAPTDATAAVAGVVVNGTRV